MGVRVVSVLSLAMSAAACISSSSVDCADGTTCPEGTACKLVPYLDAVTGSDCAATIAQPEQVCATPDQLSACSGLADRAACGGGSTGHCVSGVCIADTCGDCRVAGAEACDDGNTLSGDGCSFDCKSDETCGNHILDVVRGEVCDDGNHLSHDGCDSRCQAEVPVWTQLSNDHPGLPGSRTSAALAYDARTGHVVLFGGSVAQTDGTIALVNDTWEWDGNGWAQMPTPIAPTPRAGMAMAYSDALGEVVMFGGQDDAHDKISDTWAWNGRTWTELAVPIAPAARDGASLAYDAQRGVLVLYGGQSASISQFDDTWELDATGTWTMSAASGPPGGTVPLSYDPARGLVIGLDAETPAGTWGYDGQTWTKLATGGVSARSKTALAWDAASQTTLVFGGVDARGDVGDQWSFDGATWTEFGGRGLPPARSGDMLASDPVRGRVVMSGGDTDDVATWEWDGSTWGSALGEQPNGVDVPLLPAIDRATARTLLVNVLDAPVTGNTFVFDGFAFGAGAAPPASSNDAGALAWDDATGVAMLYIDGGDTFTWSGSAWQDVSPATGATPIANGVIAAYDAARAQVVLLDQAGDGSATATWLWTGSATAGTWSLATPAHVPPARENTAMAYDPIRQQIVLFSGGGANDTWLWNGADWTLARPPLAPTARDDAALAWNAARGALVLFGGGASTDTWEWTGSAWSQLDPDGAPDARQSPSLWPTSSGDGVRMFGGLRGRAATGGNDDHWLLRWQSADGIDEACQAHRDDDGDGLVGCADPDCWATCTPACPPGEPCDTTAPRCGDGVCNAALENCRNCPQDCTCAPVCGDFVCDPGEACVGDCGG
jgi:cysteine-rich repeat protein